MLTASNLLTLVKDVTLEGSMQVSDAISVTSSPVSRRDFLVDIQFKTFSYTFNASLTFAVMTTFWLFLAKRGKAYSEALLVLVGMHLLYIFSFEAKTLTEMLVQQGVERGSIIRLFFFGASQTPW